jgi:FkbM family methyltransferase
MVDYQLVHKLKHHNFDIKNILDIGAHKGEWTKKFREYFPDVHSLMIEANPNHAEFLQHVGEFKIALLGKNNEEVDYYECTDVQNNHGNGIYKENTNVPFKAKKRKMVTLESLVSGQFDLIKMDVQGAELDIIQGSPSIIHNTKYLWLEVNVHNYNIGAPRAGQIIAYLDQIGFEIFDVADVNHFGNEGHLLSMDLLFINSRNKSLKEGPYNNQTKIIWKGYDY